MTDPRLRSSSLGAAPRPKKLFTSRAESAAAAALDVRCACQFFQSTSLLPERINPVGSRPSSSLGYYSRPNSRNQDLGQHVFEPDFIDDPNAHPQPTDEEFSFGIVGDTDYYAESITSRPGSPNWRSQEEIENMENEPNNFSAANSQHNLNQEADLPQRPRLDSTMRQKDASQSILLQRRSSQKSSDNLAMKQKDPTRSILLQRRSSQKSFDNPQIKQRDPSTSSLLRKRMNSASEGQPPPPPPPDPAPLSLVRSRDSRYGQLNSNEDISDQKRGRKSRRDLEKSKSKKEKSDFSLMNALPKPDFSSFMTSHTINQQEDLKDASDQHAKLEELKRDERKQLDELKRIGDLKRADELRRVQELKDAEMRKLEEQRLQNEEQIRLDEQRKAEEQKKLEVQKRFEDQKRQEQQRRLEEQKRIEDQQRQEQQRQEQQRQEQQRQEQQRQDQQKKLDDQRKSEQRNIEEENNQQTENASNEKEEPEKEETKKQETEVAKPIDKKANFGFNIFAALPKPAIQDFLKGDPVKEAADREAREYQELMSLGIPSSAINDAYECKKIPPKPLPIQRSPSNNTLVHVGPKCIVAEPPSTENEDYARQSRPTEKINSNQTNAAVPYIRQRDPSTSSLLRKRYSQSVEPAAMDASGSQHSLRSNVIKQKDLTSSTLLKRRHLSRSSLQGKSFERSESTEAYNPSEKVTKTVSFEYDKKVLDAVAQPPLEPQNTAVRIPRISSDLRDKLDWVERTYTSMRDHEYEPIGEPVDAQSQPKETVVATTAIEKEVLQQSVDEEKKSVEEEEGAVGGVKDDLQDEHRITDASSITSHERKLLRSVEIDETDGENVQDLQDQMEERFLTPTPQTDHSRTDEICTSQVDSSALEDLPLRREDRKKSFISRANDKTKDMQSKLNVQAGRLRTKLKGMKKPKSESPKAKERKRFKSPEFSRLKHIQMPHIRKPDFKRPEFKRPEFTKFKTPEMITSLKKTDFKITLPDRPKFTKPDMSKFKMPERLTSLRLHRSKSLKESELATESQETETTATEDRPIPSKKRFDFGTYPRLFDKMRKSLKKEKDSDVSVSRDDEKELDEESDRMSGPVQFATVPRVNRRKKSPGPPAAWIPSNMSNTTDNDSGQYQRYESESIDRETSVERRMRIDLKDSLDVADELEDDDEGALQTEEQKQLAEYDKENRAIHEISLARKDEFRQRKPLVHQESDLASEASTNKEFGWAENEHIRSRLLAQSGDLDISEKEDYVNEALPERDHLSTQETQSSGSSSNRRRKGVIEEIDDDEFFLRKKGISQDDIQIGRYISTAIREGLDTPVNALAQLGGQYDSYYDEDFDMSNERVDFGYDVPPRKPRRVKDFEKSLESEEFDPEDDSRISYDDEDLVAQRESDFYKTFPPSRPNRKQRKQYSEDSQDEEHEVPVAAEYYPHPDEDDRSFYENEQMEGIEQPDIRVTRHGDEDYDDENEIDLDNVMASTLILPPPRAPKRRKKLLRESVDRDEIVRRSISNDYIPNGKSENVVVYRTEHEYIIPLAQPETFTTPTPTPRSRSRSQVSRITDDDRTSHGAESLAFDDHKYVIETKETNGYATVKKEPPPRPPAPVRRKRSTRSLGDRQFFTMPHQRREYEDVEDDLDVPARPMRNYSTIGPTRPPRRISVTSLDDEEKRQSVAHSDATQYEEIGSFDKAAIDPRNLNSGPVQNKMKFRPLPPPPRPPRDRKQRKPSESDDTKFDQDGGGEKIVSRLPITLEDISRISSQDMEDVEEVERSTQTDPLPDDFCCEEFEISDDMKTIEPSFARHSKTLEDILKEEQEAEIERARQIADEQCLSRGIAKFREANQRSFSERSRGSTADRPKTPSSRPNSRPITPSAVIIERRLNLNTVETDATLIVRPIEEPTVSTGPEVARIDSFEDSEIRFIEDTVDTEDERIVHEALKRYKLLDEEFREPSVEPVETPLVPPRPQIELNIREEEIFEEGPPHPPPRRKSSASESIVTAVQAAALTELEPIREGQVQSTVQTAEPPTTVQVPDPPLEVLPNSRLHITELEVDNLSVGALQAGRIFVSELQAMDINSQELECKSGNLVVKGIELPAGFMQELVDRVRTSERESNAVVVEEQLARQVEQVSTVPPQVTTTTQHPTETEPPARPPPPQSIFPSDYLPYSIPPPSFYNLRNYSDELEPPPGLHSPTLHRRRRHHRRRDDSTSEEDQNQQTRSDRRSRHNTRSPEPSIGELSGQLARACSSAISRTGSRLYNIVKSKKQEENRRDINIGLIVLIVIIAVLMMLGMNSDRAVHHHHWDYFNPPDNAGRQ